MEVVLSMLFIVVFCYMVFSLDIGSPKPKESKYKDPDNFLEILDMDFNSSSKAALIEDAANYNSLMFIQEAKEKRVQQWKDDHPVPAGEESIGHLSALVFFEGRVDSIYSGKEEFVKDTANRLDKVTEIRVFLQHNPKSGYSDTQAFLNDLYHVSRYFADEPAN